MLVQGRHHDHRLEHLLQPAIDLHYALKQDVYPQLISPNDKLYSNLEELRRTAAFMQATGTSIL